MEADLKEYKGTPIEVRIAERIKEYRKKRGLSQQELADMCGLSRKTIGKLEAGESDYSVGKLDAIGKALGIKFILVPDEDLI